MFLDAYCREEIPPLINGNYSVNISSALFNETNAGAFPLNAKAFYECNIHYKMNTSSNDSVYSICTETTDNTSRVTNLAWTNHDVECLRKLNNISSECF